VKWDKEVWRAVWKYGGGGPTLFTTYPLGSCSNYRGLHSLHTLHTLHILFFSFFKKERKKEKGGSRLARWSEESKRK